MTGIKNTLALAAVRLNAAIREAHANGLVVHIEVDHSYTPDGPTPMPNVNVWTKPALLPSIPVVVNDDGSVT